MADNWNRSCWDYKDTDGNMTFVGLYWSLPKHWFMWPFVFLFLAPCCAVCAPLIFKASITHDKRQREEQGLISAREEADLELFENQSTTDLMVFCCLGTSSVAFTFIALSIVLPFLAIPLLEKLHWRHLNREVFFCLEFPAFHSDYQYDVAFGYYMIWPYAFKILDDIRSISTRWNDDPSGKAFGISPLTYGFFTCICLPIVWIFKFLQTFFRCKPPPHVNIYQYWIVQTCMSTYTELAIVITMCGFKTWYLWLGLFVLSVSSWITSMTRINLGQQTVRTAFKVQLFCTDIPQVLGTILVYITNRPIDEFVIFNFISKILGTIRMSHHLCKTHGMNEALSRDDESDDVGKECASASE
jgi:hypothetical protein